MSFGVSMAQRGLWSEALFRFEQAARLEPQSGRALANMAVAYEAMGRFDDARATYERAVKVDPANPDIKRNQARFLEFLAGFRAKPGTSPATPTAPAAPVVNPPANPSSNAGGAS
jgi:Flp pilus assembly protein TadD